MSKAGGKHLGPRTKDKGKGAGEGALTDLQQDIVGENQVLSNRDDRGQHSKWVQTEQMQNHAVNKGRG